ncbi:uncharacterized protein TNCV_3200531 [Trichonephila clavipes]|nr:uncharacterized protein TNCV_3200531 [Trichonephila clavipes]
MSKKSPFAIHKALIGIGGEPKTVKRLRSGDILIETHYALQTKSFLLVNTFLDSPVTICPHKSLNTARGVLSESDLLSTPESEILEGFSYQEARKLIVPQTSHTYAQAAKSSTRNSSTQTDENITKIKCPPLELLQPLSSKTGTNLSISTPDVSTSSSSTQAQLLPSTSSIPSGGSPSLGQNKEKTQNAFFKTPNPPHDAHVNRTLNIDKISLIARFLLLSLEHNEMGKKSPFLIQKALVGIGGEPKSVKRLRSGDLLLETNSALQTKSFFLAKTFLDSPVNIIPHKSLNTSRGVISEPDLLTTPEAEILDGFSDQGVIQVRRVTIKKDTAVIPTQHIILTFSSPTIPHTIKAGYLNCKIRPYIPNPLRCFKCQRFDTHKLPVAVNLLALDVRLLDMLPQIAV